MRHSLYALRVEDVMAADFEHVAWVTFALLALVVGAMVGLNTVGVAQVREFRNVVFDHHPSSRFAFGQAKAGGLAMEKEVNAQDDEPFAAELVFFQHPLVPSFVR